MKALVPLMEKHAEQCVELAYRCRDKNAERFFRLLAVDLMLAAEQHRPRHTECAVEHTELNRLSHEVAADPAFKSESASTV